MKHLLTILTMVLLSGAAVQCHKNKTCRPAIVHKYYSCNAFGIQFEGDTFLYLANGLPPEFQFEGASLCITYTVSDDMRMCPAPCCGGKIVNIISIWQEG